MSGCTATTAIVTNDRIYVANSGDSRTIIGVKGIAKPLSFDHKPQNEGERARIVAAGGFVESDRVNGNLALSRAIGDFDFKRSVTRPPEEQIVTAFPDVMEHQISPDDEFLVLACDGIWDCMHSQTVIEFVRRGIADKQKLAYICENIMDHCLAPASDMSGIGCDNMTILIVGILNGKTEEEWYDMIAKRVENGEGPVASKDSTTPVAPSGPVGISTSRGYGNDDDPDNGAAAYDDLFRRTVGTGMSLQQLLGNNATVTTSSNGTLVIKSSSNILSALQGDGTAEDSDEEFDEHQDENTTKSRIEPVEDIDLELTGGDDELKSSSSVKSKSDAAPASESTKKTETTEEKAPTAKVTEPSTKSDS